MKKICLEFLELRKESFLRVCEPQGIIFVLEFRAAQRQIVWAKLSFFGLNTFRSRKWGSFCCPRPENGKWKLGNRKFFRIPLNDPKSTYCDAPLMHATLWLFLPNTHECHARFNFGEAFLVHPRYTVGNPFDMLLNRN